MAVSAVLVGNWLLNGIQINDTVMVVAHRGASGKAPENSLASIRQAISDGADWVEIDVQETADGEVIVVHDSDFMKLAGIDLTKRQPEEHCAEQQSEDCHGGIFCERRNLQGC